MKQWKRIFQVAATYIGTVVGAGFASGQEILKFFTVLGWVGVFAIALSTTLFIWLGAKIMLISHQQQCYSYQQLNIHLFGRKIGGLFNILVLIILFGTTGVMLSGAGSILVEQFRIPFQIGVIGTILLTVLVMYRGMSGVMWVNAFVVPLMFIFMLALAFQLIGEPLPSNNGIVFNTSFKWITSAILYSAFNLTMAQAVLVPMGKEEQDPTIVIKGGIAGGIGLGLMLLIGHLSLQFHYDSIHELEIPMAAIISQYGSFLGLMFALVVFGEIFTTIIGNVFGLARQIESNWNIPQILGTFLILFGSFLLSQWGFKTLVQWLYPLFGMIGVIFLVRLGVYKRTIHR